MLGVQGHPCPISQLRRVAEGRSRQEFLGDYPHPVFVVEPFEAPDNTGFATIVGVKGAGDEDLVVSLRKRPGANAFSHMITIGRSGNNDVVIRYRGISKFHAYLPVPLEGTPRQLVDAGSTNGTFVRDVELEGHGASAPLEPGYEVRLSDLRLVYYDAESFYEFLTSRR